MGSFACLASSTTTKEDFFLKKLKKWQLKNQKPQRVGRLQSNEDVADLRDQPNLKVEEDQKVVFRKQRTQRLQRPQEKHASCLKSYEDHFVKETDLLAQSATYPKEE